MDTPGKLLKTAREEKGKSLEDFANLLKIRYEYLKAIENEDYQFISGEVFVKGYMRIYATALGLDSDYILDLYKKQISTSQQTEQPVRVKTWRLPKVYKFPAIIISIVLIVLFLILLFSYNSHKPNVKSAKEFKKHEVLPVEKPKMLSLLIIATEETWVSVNVDRGISQERLLKAGEVMRWTASEGFSIKIGNAGGARVIFNGKDIGDLGPHGKVVKLNLPGNKVDGEVKTKNQETESRK